MSDDVIEQLYDRAESLLDDGRVEEALLVYNKICALDPEDPEARYMCGLVNMELGRSDKAVECLKAAIDIDPRHGPAHLSLAGVLAELGNHGQALINCRQATQLDQVNGQAWLMLAGLYGHEGMYEHAEQAAKRSIELVPDSVEASANLGNALREQGKLQEAAAAFQKALQLRGDSGQLLVALGNTHERMGGFATAVECYRKALALDASSVTTLTLLGNSLVELGAGDEGLECFQRALALDPSSAYLEYRVGLLFGEKNMLDEAMLHYKKAIGFSPEFAEVHDAAGTIHRFKREFDDAMQSYRRAVEVKPNFAAAYINLADLLQEDGRYLESIECYESALRYTDSDAVKIKHATALPVILSSAGEIGSVRERFASLVDALSQDQLHVDNPFSEISRTSFYLAYHGLDDLTLHRSLAGLYEKAAPSLLFTAQHCRIPVSYDGVRKIKVGMISRFFFRHTIGTVMKRFVERFSRDRFHITVITFPYPPDEVTEYIYAHADRVVVMPKDWRQAHEVIGREELDVIFYTDIGMDPYTYFLSFARLAPVQFTTWGHPVSTGVGNVDYYLTCRYFEPEEGARHYSERLVELTGLPTFYEKPMPVYSDKTRDDYGIGNGRHVYLCPQTLYKFHPNFDEILANILRRDPDGVIVLVDCPHRHWQELLMARLQLWLPDVHERIKILPYPGADEYLHLLTLADVMLDTIHYGGGSTSLQALAFGVPIVTLPGGLQKGRHTYGYYKLMGFMDCVASNGQEYVEKAFRLASDAGYRSTVSKKILMKNHVLYENQDVVDEIEVFMESALARACAVP